MTYERQDNEIHFNSTTLIPKSQQLKTVTKITQRIFFILDQQTIKKNYQINQQNTIQSRRLAR